MVKKTLIRSRKLVKNQSVEFALFFFQYEILSKQFDLFGTNFPLWALMSTKTREKPKQ